MSEHHKGGPQLPTNFSSRYFTMNVTVRLPQWRPQRPASQSRVLPTDGSSWHVLPRKQLGSDPEPIPKQGLELTGKCRRVYTEDLRS